MDSFLPGLELSRQFYEEAVAPLLKQHFPDLIYAAAHIGAGSEVLGFDTPMSMDHSWGPQLFLFLKKEDLPRIPQIDHILQHHLPHTFLGFPVGVVEAELDPGIMQMDYRAEGPVKHQIHLLSLHDFILSYLEYDLDLPLTIADWLTIPSQAFLSLTRGAVYDDGVGELTALRKQLAWYPHNIWLYLLASGWQRIGQEEHLMPRAGIVGDELGSSLIGSRLIHDSMYLCFLMEKQYAPYPKWFGTAFQQLNCAKRLGPVLWRVQQALTWQERTDALAETYSYLAHMHNALALTRPLPEAPSPFHNRPFKIIHGSLFAQALIEQISEPETRNIASRRLIGNIDQLSDNTDLISSPSWRPALRKLYE